MVGTSSLSEHIFTTKNKLFSMTPKKDRKTSVRVKGVGGGGKYPVSFRCKHSLTLFNGGTYKNSL